jgi:hypothetical protein
MIPGRQYYFKVGHQLVAGTVTKIDEVIDVNTFEKSSAEELTLNTIANVTVQLNKAVVVDSYTDNRHTGAFIVIDRLSNGTVAAGMIVDQAQTSSIHVVTDSDRERRYHQKPVTIILDTDDASERAVELEQVLFTHGHACVIVRPEDALTVCPYIEAAGLLAIVAGGKDLPFGYNYRNMNTAAVIDDLAEKGVLISL